MKRRMLLMIAGVLFPGAFVFATDAHVLFERHFGPSEVSGASGLIGEPSISPDIRVTTAVSYTPLAKIFEGITIDPSDVGKTYVANATNDSGFADYARYLTDGVEHWASVPSGGGFSYGSECGQFHGNNSCGAGVAFEGYALDQVTYTIKDWYFISPGRDPNHDGFWTDTFMAWDFTIEGHAVAEPSSIALLLTAAVAAVGYRLSRARAAL